MGSCGIVWKVQNDECLFCTFFLYFAIIKGNSSGTVISKYDCKNKKEYTMQVYLYYQKFDKTKKSHTLLKNALADYLRETGSREETTDMTIVKDTKFGKPYVKELPNVFFSISHSGCWWACACADQEVGLDLQVSGEKEQQKIAKRFFHREETEWLGGQEPSEFYRLWAYKESYVKYTGIGLAQGLDYFSVVSKQKDTLGAAGVEQQELAFPDADYWLVLTAKNKASVVLRELEETDKCCVVEISSSRIER